MNLSIRDFSCCCVANSNNIISYITSCNNFTYFFSSGVYILRGDIDSGAWALCYAISHKSNKVIISESTSFFIDGSKISPKNIYKFVCYIGERKRNKIFFNSKFFPYIKKIVKKYKFNISAIELFKLFNIDKDYYYRKIKYLGSEYYQLFLLLLGFIKGKKIFTTSWCGSLNFDCQSLNKIGKILETQGCILIIPSSCKNNFDNSFKKIEWSRYRTGD